MSFNRVCIIGVGLLGGSMALAMKRYRQATTVVGCGSSAASLATALDLAVIDEAEADVARAVRACDLVVLAMPVAAMATCMQEIAPNLSEQAIVTDVGSVKGAVLQAAKEHLPKQGCCFVPAHPIAGKEHSGVHYADADLFRDHMVLLTPGAVTDTTACARITALWASLGAQVHSLAADHHDALLSYTSHLPHLLSFALMQAMAGAYDTTDFALAAAGGFADFSRIAGSNPTMWRDISLLNRDAVMRALDDYQAALNTLRDAVSDGDATALMDFFSAAQVQQQAMSAALAVRHAH